MSRKQITIAPIHQAVLRRLARSRGVSEAEVVRQAIEREDAGRLPVSFVHDSTALEEIIAYAMGRRRHSGPGKPYDWDREEVYAERLECDDKGPPQRGGPADDIV